MTNKLKILLILIVGFVMDANKRLNIQAKRLSKLEESTCSHDDVIKRCVGDCEGLTKVVASLSRKIKNLEVAIADLEAKEVTPRKKPAKKKEAKEEKVK